MFLKNQKHTHTVTVAKIKTLFKEMKLSGQPTAIAATTEKTKAVHEKEKETRN